MRGVWRAWAAGLVAGLGPVGIVLVAGQSSSVLAGVLLAGLLAALPGLALLKPTIEAERFIQGMRRSCGRVEVLEDRIDWAMRRRMLVETPVGSWRIKGTVNPIGRGIVVRPPQAHGVYRVREEPCEAGRVLMARLITAQPVAADEPTVSPAGQETKASRLAGGA